jgi:LysM repeat protein
VISYSTKPNGEEHTTTYTASSGHNQSVVINDLLPNTTYYVKVRVQNGCMPGEWSATRSLVTTPSSSQSFLNQNEMIVEELQINTTLPSDCTYTVLYGDTLWKLAEDAYGNGDEYQKIIDLNRDEYPNIRQVLTVGSTLTFPCESTNESLPHDHDDEGNSVSTYTNAVTIYVENEGIPLGGVDVELHSDPKYGKTDENGKVVFTNVEPGEHTLILASGSYNAEQKITVDEGIKDFDIKVSITMEQNAWYHDWIFVVLGVTIGIALFWLLLFLKKRKKNTDSDKTEASQTLK